MLLAALLLSLLIISLLLFCFLAAYPVSFMLSSSFLELVVKSSGWHGDSSKRGYSPGALIFCVAPTPPSPQAEERWSLFSELLKCRPGCWLPLAVSGCQFCLCAGSLPVLHTPAACGHPLCPERLFCRGGCSYRWLSSLFTSVILCLSLLSPSSLPSEACVSRFSLPAESAPCFAGPVINHTECVGWDLTYFSSS